MRIGIRALISLLHSKIKWFIFSIPLLHNRHDGSDSSLYIFMRLLCSIKQVVISFSLTGSLLMSLMDLQFIICKGCTFPFSRLSYHRNSRPEKDGICSVCTVLHVLYTVFLINEFQISRSGGFFRFHIASLDPISSDVLKVNWRLASDF